MPLLVANTIANVALSGYNTIGKPVVNSKVLKAVSNYAFDRAKSVGDKIARDVGSKNGHGRCPLTEENLRIFNAEREPLEFTDADILQANPISSTHPNLHSLPLTDDDFVERADTEVDSDTNLSLLVAPPSKQMSAWEFESDDENRSGVAENNDRQSRAQRGFPEAIKAFRIAKGIIGHMVSPSGRGLGYKD